MVSHMKRIRNAVISDINEVITVYSKKGRLYKTNFRRNFGVSFCKSGSIAYTINGKTVISDSGCAVILPYGGRYTLYGTKTGYFPLINFSVKTPTLIHDIIKIPLGSSDFYMKEYKKLKQAEIFGHSHFEKMQILYSILKNLLDESVSVHPALKTAVMYIEQNFSDSGLTNEILAAESGISEVYLRKLFVSGFGTTPKQYIIDIRIQKAKQLLEENKYSVSEIADMCGFTNIYHFCRTFKAFVNMTPSEYKAHTFADTGFLL